jgi:uncharacterized iron-regulated membrane protein
MSREFLKRLTEAHSWLGLIISGAIFVVFFAGSISLFRDEIEQWSMQPHLAISEGEKLPISQIVERAIEGVPFDPKEHLTLITPIDNRPYYEAYVDVHHEAGEEDHVHFFIDPNTGEKFGNIDGFKLADFIYDLHTDLNIPAGTYVVGFITLFLFFAVVSGVFIHARKLVNNFFQYRSENNPRSKLLDIHNVVGVMSLPFTLMYAFSGLIFNLVIIYQIAFAVFLYQGDKQALLNDGGYNIVKVEWQNKAWETPDIDGMYNEITEKYQKAPRIVRIYNYGDESAVMHVFVTEKNSLTENYEIAYNLTDRSINFVRDADNPNVLRQGLYVITKLHFGDYAGVDLRILYFILGLGVCVLIVTGNLLWIEKRSKKRNQSPKTLSFVNNFTLWSTGGVILSTAVAFLVDRLSPMQLVNRDDYMVYSFIFTLLVVAVLLVFNHNKKSFLGWLLKVSGYIAIAVVVVDWVMFNKEIVTLWQQGVTTIIGTEIVLVIIATLLIFIGRKLANKPSISTNINSKEVINDVVTTN